MTSPRGPFPAGDCTKQLAQRLGELAAGAGISGVGWQLDAGQGRVTVHGAPLEALALHVSQACVELEAPVLALCHADVRLAPALGGSATRLQELPYRAPGGPA